MREAPGFRRRAAVLAAAASLLLTAACANGSAGDESEGIGPVGTSPRAEENRAVFVSLQDPGTLDYVTNNLTALTLWMPANVVEPLVRFDADGEAEPAVAEDWEVSADQRTYTFFIREATFSTGEPVTAQDVVFSLTAMQESSITTYSAPYEAVDSIEATGEREVTVQLDRPSQAFFQGMGGMSALIQPEAAADEIATNPVGTGPYVLESYTPNSGMTFTRNPDYWGEQPELDEIDVRIIPDGTAALNALRAGEVDSMPVITIDLWDRMTSEGFDDVFQTVTYPQAGEMLFLAFNAERPPFDDPAVRQAFAQSIDRQQFIDVFNAQWGVTPTCGYGLSDDPQFTEEEACPYPTDLDAAQAGLEASGYSGEPIDFASLSDVPDLSLPADLLIAQFQGAGATIQRNAMELARYAQLIFQGRPPDFGVTIMSDPNPVEQFACRDQAEAGWTTYCSPEMTALLDEADAATSTEEYEQLMLQANEVLMEEASIVGILAKDAVGMFHPDLTGWEEPQIHNEVEFANFSW